MTIARLPVVVVLDNVRSLYNTGSFFRTADACAVQRLVLCGITPRPDQGSRQRRGIAKTALGAELAVPWEHQADTQSPLSAMAAAGYQIVAVEASPTALELYEWRLRRVSYCTSSSDATCTANADDHVYDRSGSEANDSCGSVLESPPRRSVTMKALLVPAVVILALISSVQLSAHHTWPVSYGQLVTVKGTVMEFSWENPHPMITLEVRTEDGKTEKWMVGGPAIGRMEANGWTKTTVKPGDVITGIGYQFNDGQKIIRLERVVLADGKEIKVYGR